MTIEEIKTRLEYIKKVSGDYEIAHREEDLLLADFIRYVADKGPIRLANKAKLVLKSLDLEFPRYTA